MHLQIWYVKTWTSDKMQDSVHEVGQIGKYFFCHFIIHHRQSVSQLQDLDAEHSDIPYYWAYVYLSGETCKKKY